MNTIERDYLNRTQSIIDALNEATGWEWEGAPDTSFRGWAVDSEQVASVLSMGDSFGALVKHDGQVHSATGSLESVLKFLKGFSQSE